jgi:hypothetical protein
MTRTGNASILAVVVRSGRADFFAWRHPGGRGRTLLLRQSMIRGRAPSGGCIGARIALSG